MQLAARLCYLTPQMTGDQARKGTVKKIGGLREGNV